ncbi:MAG: DeoR/GlpR transcriptional regulator [Clostridia bacterium]|nr:DeoR/GlpR transcriptional regulator [Clostridia bacterium]
MFANERQNKICEILDKKGAVTTSALMERFNVSIETVRRDLLQLEQQKLLKRVHGGAVANTRMKPFFTLEERNSELNDEKKELSLAAINFIEENDCIFVDTGSTAIYFSEALKEMFSSLTVVTHSADVFDILKNHKNFSVILTGGHYNKEEKSFYGTLALDMLSNICVNKAFICPSAVSLSYGICDYEHELCTIQKFVIQNTDLVYILADSSKFEKKALIKTSDMKKEYIYITDSNLSEEIKRLYKENDINVISKEK